ncbi:hypothetical protein AY600_08770 [Phormidium willei BDU 130791]|nr:hypothetical protein AY600_08770 [Phormidium willei BDU 130791]
MPTSPKRRATFAKVQSGSRAIPWDRLTCQHRKRELFSREAAFREAWATFPDIFHSQVQRLLHRTATIVLKPEAIAGRRLDAVLTVLRREGFVPLVARPLLLSQPMACALWQYQWNKATVDRIRLHLYVAQRCSSLFIILEDQKPELIIPASVRLWGLKGPTDERRREPYHLRSAIGMKNRMIGFVHTADEPADIVREQGLFFDENERTALWLEAAAALGSDRTSAVRRVGRLLEGQTPAHSIDISEVAERLRQRGDHQTHQLLQALEFGENWTLREIATQFGDLCDEAARWDFVTLAAELIAHDLPHAEPILSAMVLEQVRRKWMDATH